MRRKSRLGSVHAIIPDVQARAGVDLSHLAWVGNYIAEKRPDVIVQIGDFASFIRAVSIGAFVLLTTPVAGHVIARAAYFADVPLWKGTVLDERRQDAGGRPQTDGSIP